MRHLLAAFLLLAAISLPAMAQTVWRCPDGYRQQPCEDGRAVDVSDPRSRAQQSEADAASRRDAKLANQLQKDRESEESQPVSAYLPPPQPEAGKDKESRNAKPARPFTATATAPGSAKDRKKTAGKNSPARASRAP